MLSKPWQQNIEEIKSLHTSFTQVHTELYCIALWKGYRIYGEREEVMERIVDQKANRERTQNRIFKLLTKCIKDIEKTVTMSGLKIEDVRSEKKNSRQAWILASMV